MTNVIKSRIYGKQPHDIYTVLFNTDKEQADSVNLTVPTLDDLSAALGDSFIPQSELVQTLADFEHESSVSFSDEAKLNFVKEQVKKAINAYDTAEGVGCVNNFYFEYGQRLRAHRLDIRGYSVGKEVREVSHRRTEVRYKF